MFGVGRIASNSICWSFCYGRAYPALKKNAGSFLQSARVEISSGRRDGLFEQQRKHLHDLLAGAGIIVALRFVIGEFQTGAVEYIRVGLDTA